jgi:arginyl-tRNA synthetase
MKININLIKSTPPNLAFNFCVYGEPPTEVKQWIEYHNLSTISSGKYTNIIIPKNVNISDLFIENELYEYMDGFSPNLNKNLHVGHLSNLTLASVFQSMGITKNVISIMGDTLNGEVDPEEAFENYENTCDLFNFSLGEIFYASKMKYNGDLLVDGVGDYEGTKVFNTDTPIVGIKSDGSTSYFYQDVALASHLNAKTIYLTGFEQDNHFNQIKSMFPHTDHIGLGLVMIDGKKMSSSDGNIIFASDIIDKFKNEFKDTKVGVNILKGQILKSKPSSVKNINTKDIHNPKTSFGLYLSYTTARLNSAGLTPNENINEFISKELEYIYLKSKYNLTPNTFLKGLVELSGKINNLYLNHTIKGNEGNQKMFQPLLDDLVYGMDKLGMYYIEKI